MKKDKRLRVAAVIGLLVLASLPQFLIYYRGYYYVTNAPASLKYPLNAGCFLGVALLGYWYLKQLSATVLSNIWALAYLLGGLFIASEYIYHFSHPDWGTQTYLNTMGLFEALVSPMPFIIAWLLLRVMKMVSKS